VLHAFKLLHRVLVEPRPTKKRSTGFVTLPPMTTSPAAPNVLNGSNGNGAAESVSIHYSLRHEPDPHRPWIMYYAALSICSFVRAIHGSPARVASAPPPPLQSQHHQSGGGGGGGGSRHGSNPQQRVRIANYLSRVAAHDELDERVAATLLDGLPDLLEGLAWIMEGAHSELLQEAHDRLRVCKDMLLGR
jgi:hypothetical protein